MTVRLVAFLASATSFVTWIVWRQLRAGSRSRRSLPAQPLIQPIIASPALLSPNPVLGLSEPPEETPLLELADNIRTDAQGTEASAPLLSQLESNELLHSVNDSGMENDAQSQTVLAPPAENLDEFAEEAESSALRSNVDIQFARNEGSSVIDSNSVDTEQRTLEGISQLESHRTTHILPIEDDDESAILLGYVAVIEEPPLLPTDEDESSEDFPDADLDEAPRKLPRYRPPSRKSLNTNREATLPSERKRRESSWLQLDIVVHITFDRYGFCAVHLLPVHTPELNETALARYTDGLLELVAQEDWYQDLAFEKIASYLRDGIELSAVLGDRQRVRWTLKGRDVYVLASHQDASGFVSTSRLVLGRPHLVLCLETQVGEVQQLLHEAGCGTYTRADQSSGVPEGWILFSGVTPTQAVTLGEGADLYYPLKPAPDLEIELEGGIRIRNSAWLVGYPPRIKLFGQISDSASILIDGVEAQRSPDGTLLADGYDLPGQHNLICEGLSHSRSYSIEDAPASWEMWPAYHFRGASICGPLVQPCADLCSKNMVCVPTSNPLLIGAEPGQIFRCTVRSVGVWKGLIPFDAVWALPAHPLICKKATARIIQLTDLPPRYSATPGRAELNWCSAVLDAARKGLQIDSNFPDPASAWAAYRKAARRIRKRSRR